MPSWNIHLEAGTRLADQLKLRGTPRDEFLLGCLLPDINNGYVNSPAVVYPHHSTHYARNDKSSLNFYADYKAQITSRDPFYLAYLFHLFTDGYFNYHFYHHFSRIPKSRTMTEDEKRAVKHHDFWLYDTNFHHALSLPANLAPLVTKANTIKTVSIAEKDLQEVNAILQDGHLNDDIKGEDYLFYNTKTLATLLNDTISEFICQYIIRDTPGPRPARELHDDPTMSRTPATKEASHATEGNHHA